MKNLIKWLTILFQSIAIGSLILYGYAFFRYRKTWEVLDSRVKSNINTYLVVGLVTLGIFILIKLFDIFVLKKKTDKVVVSETPETPIISVPEEAYIRPEYIPQEQIVVEAPKAPEIKPERQRVCPNCNSKVDKDAYICLTCGILLKNIEQQNEKVVYKEVVVKNQEGSTKSMLTSVAMMVLVVLVMFIAYDYTRNNGVFFNEEMSQLEKKQYVYTLASEVLNDFEVSINTNRVRLDKNNSYFSLADLGYNSFEYNPAKSYVAVNQRAKEYYIIFQGQGKYKDYSIDTVMKNSLNLDDVKLNKAPAVPTNDMLFIDGQMFYKGDN